MFSGRKALPRSIIVAGALALGVLGASSLAPAHGLMAPTSASAAVYRAYANGPVVFLNKSETRYLAATGGGGGGALLGGLLGDVPGAVAGATVGSWGTEYVDQHVDHGQCIQIKMWYWDPWWTAPSFYSYAPWCY